MIFEIWGGNVIEFLEWCGNLEVYGFIDNSVDSGGLVWEVFEDSLRFC